ncbi:MAG: phosphotransferase family protein [Acidobacteriota bacterium]|nr:phosphotransferase family protein [Acidobacteriota bacterium]
MAGGGDGRLRAVRDGDRLDSRALAAWLRESIAGLDGGEPEVRQFSGGSSNLTYLLRFSSRDVVVRCPPGGARSGTAHDMVREYTLQRRLRPHYPLVPEVWALCEDLGVIGRPFYAMERVDGVVPGRRMPPAIGTQPARMAALAERFVAAWARLHAIDVEAAGLADIGRGPGYVERQVSQWSERYRRARTPNVPDFERVMRWLEENRPPDTGTCMIHNDFRLDNMVLGAQDPLQIRAVLDWELATVGDPMMDLGCSLVYCVEPADGLIARRFKRQPTDLPGFPTREELVRRYGEITGRDVGSWAFYGVFGLFRLAVIAQQIYRRYREGDSTNGAFRFFWVGVRSAHRRCNRLIRQA